MYTCMGEWAGTHLGADLDWKQSPPGACRPKHGASDSLPSDKAGTHWHWQTSLDSYQCDMLINTTHTSDPIAPLLLFHTMRLFVSGLISRDSCLKPQERFEWLLIPVSIWDAVKQTRWYHWFHANTAIHRDCSFSVEITDTLFVWAVTLKGIFIIRPTQGEIQFKCHKSSCLRKDNQSECHGEGSEVKAADLQGHVHPQDPMFCLNFSAPNYSSH